MLMSEVTTVNAVLCDGGCERCHVCFIRARNSLYFPVNQNNMQIWSACVVWIIRNVVSLGDGRAYGAGSEEHTELGTDNTEKRPPVWYLLLLLLLFICLLQLDWRPVAAVTYMYTNINYGSNVLETGMAAWEACSSNLEFWEPSQHLLIDTGKPSKTCAEMASRRTFQILTFGQQSGTKVNGTLEEAWILLQILLNSSPWLLIFPYPVLCLFPWYILSISFKFAFFFYFYFFVFSLFFHFTCRPLKI